MSSDSGQILPGREWTGVGRIGSRFMPAFRSTMAQKMAEDDCRKSTENSTEQDKAPNWLRGARLFRASRRLTD